MSEVSGRRFALRSKGFTLIELLVVITIIVILMGLLFPAFRGVQDQAKKTQAKNDLTQIVTAVTAFYTEYGKYPLPAGTAGDGYPVGGSTGNSSKAIFDALRGIDPILNPRQVAFLNPPDAKDQNAPRGGIKTTDGQFYDPWGKVYFLTIDADYDNQVPNPYTADTGAGGAEIRQGVVGLSLGTDGLGGSGAKHSTPSGPGDDDVISWQ